MANVEVQVKAIEKRLSGIEKKIDDYDKQFRQIDYGALVKKLENLEKAVGMLAASLKDPKKVGGGKMLDEKAAEKLAEAIAERKIEKVRKEHEQIMKKAMADINKSQLESRLKFLEAQVATAMAMASK